MQTSRARGRHSCQQLPIKPQRDRGRPRHARRRERSRIRRSYRNHKRRKFLKRRHRLRRSRQSRHHQPHSRVLGRAIPGLRHARHTNHQTKQDRDPPRARCCPAATRAVASGPQRPHRPISVAPTPEKTSPERAFFTHAHTPAPVAQRLNVFFPHNQETGHERDACHYDLPPSSRPSCPYHLRRSLLKNAGAQHGT